MLSPKTLLLIIREVDSEDALPVSRRLQAADNGNSTYGS